MNLQNAAAALYGVSGAQVRAYRVGGARVAPYRTGIPAVMANPQQAPIEYGPEQYRSGGNSFLGLGRTVIPAGSPGTTVNIRPVRPFNPLEMRFPSTVVGLMIHALDIQGVNFFANQPGLGLPIELLSEVATFKGMDLTTIQPETGITFTVGNPGATDLIFMGAFRGTQVLI